MLLTGLNSRLVQLHEWVAVHGTELTSSVAAYRPVVLNAPSIAACRTKDPSITQLLTCLPNTVSDNSLCQYWAEFGSTGNCKLLTSLNSTSQTVTIHNQETHAVKWNIIYDMDRDTISLSNTPSDSLVPRQKYYVSESFELSTMKSVSFPFTIFGDQSNHNDPSYKSEAVRMLYTCHRLHRIWNELQLSSRASFLIQSDNTHVHAEHSLQHQLELCNIHAPTVYMYHSDHDYLFVNNSVQRSRCTVQQVTHLAPVSCYNDTGRTKPGMTNVAGTALVPGPTHTHNTGTCVHSPIGPTLPVCIEDIMYHLLYTTATTTANMSVQNNITITSLNYVSSIGFQRTAAISKDGAIGSIVDRNIMGFRDWITVLRAYTNAEVTVPLIVQSFGDTSINTAASTVSTALPDAKITKALSRHILELLLIFESDAAPAASFNHALHQLSTTLTTLLIPTNTTTTTLNSKNTNLPADQVWCPVRAVLLDTLTHHFGEESTKFAHSCRKQKAGGLPVTYLCAHHTARQQLHDVISKQLDNASDRSLNLLDKHIFNLVAKLVSSDAATADLIIPPIIKATPTELNILVAGDVFVFIFVRPEHVPYAQQLVYHWQRHGADTTNFLFMKYLIYPIYGPTTTKTKAGAHDDVPSIHAVLSILKTKINQLTSVKDVVYVLIGLEAALSFPQPGRLLAADEAELISLCKNQQVKRDVTCEANTVNVLPHERHLLEDSECNLCTAPAYTATDSCAFLAGTIPSVPYGWSKNLRLPAKIIISAERVTASNTEGLPWGFTAMAGIGYKLLDMINSLHSAADNNSFSNDNFGSHSLITTYTLQRKLQHYALTHPSDVTLDCSQNVFHPTKAALLYQMFIKHQQKGFVSYNDLPILRDAMIRPAGNDTVSAMATALGILIKYDYGNAVNTIAPHKSVDKANNKAYDDAANAYGYHKYRAAANKLLSAYLDDTNDYADLKNIIRGEIEYSNILLPLMELENLPFPRNYLSKSIVPSDAKYKCYLDLTSYKAVNDHIFKVIYLPNHITSAVLSIINLIHQVVVCECEDLKYSMEETAYHFIRIGLLGKYVTHYLPEEEYQVTAALLENYETFLQSVLDPKEPNIDTDSATSDADTYYRSASEINNTIYGSLLDSKNVFTSGVLALYSNLSTYNKNQLLIAVRFALAGVRIEHGIYPAVAHSLQKTFQVQTYEEVNQSRETWREQKAKLEQYLLQGLVDNGSRVTRNLTKDRSINMNTNVGVVVDRIGDDPTSMDPSESTSSVNSSTKVPVIRTHYVTYASDHTEGLQNLLDSAKMSGINIEVLGLNTHYEDYSSKTDAYMNYLHNSTGPHTRGNHDGDCANKTAAAVPDDDVVLFMDAYDVLVFPAIVKAASVLAQSSTPIMFCAERGVYPEMAGPVFYPRGVKNPYQPTYSTTTDPTVDIGYSADGSESSIESSAFSVKFLNSGCVMGRAGQLKHMMSYAHFYSRTYRDDQLAMVRYHIEHPGTVSLDVNNALFATSFKLATAPQDIQLAYDLRLYQGNVNIGLLHCNNLKSGITYPTIVHNIKHALDKYYHGEEGELLQTAIQLYSAGHIQEAIQMLDHPVILQNCTTMGGINPLRHFLLQRIRLEN